MNILAVDTSSSICLVAIRKGEKLYVEEREQGWHHLQNLLPAIQRQLKASHSRLKELDLLVCSDGPGSFTGLRIGFATLKGLVAGCKLPYVHIPMLTIYRHYVRRGPFPCAVTIPITKQRAIIASYNSAHSVAQLQDIDYAALSYHLSQLAKQYAAPITLYVREQTTLEIINATLNQNIPSFKEVIAQIVPVKSLAQALIASGEARFHKSGGSGSSDQPRYFRLIDAELVSPGNLGSEGNL